MIIALEEFGIEQLIKLATNVYDAGIFPEDLSRSIFIAMSETNGDIDFELHRTFSLMIHATEILLRATLLRARSKVRKETSEEQYGFMDDRGTRNAIFILRLMERG